MMHAVTLSDFARHYTRSRDISSEYAHRLIKRAEMLESSAGEQAVGLALLHDNVNGLLASLGGLSPYTQRSYREDLMTLWLAAADEGLAAQPNPRQIRRTKTPDLVVECYFVEEARELLAYAKTLKGRYPNGVPRRDYWKAAIPLAWDSGIRRGDVWTFHRNLVRPDRTIRLVQAKTGKLVDARLRQSTVAALDEVGSPRPCAWPMTARYFGRQFERIIRGSGVNRGSFKWLRRASGSYVELYRPGSGHKHLGNERRVFERNYDAKLGGHSLPMPPEL